MAEWNWDWKRGLPPSMTVPSLFPSLEPMTDVGIPASTSTDIPVLPPPETRRPPIVTGPGPAGNITAPGVTGVKFDSGVPLGDFTNPSPTQPVETADQKFRREVQEAIKKGDFNGALAAIGKGVNAKKAPITTQPFHVSAPSHLSQGKDLSQAGGGFMSKGLEELAKYSLLAGRKPGEQGRYDILKGRG